MGLDQMAFRVDRATWTRWGLSEDTMVDFDAPDNDPWTPTYIATWRKHPDLQGWMEHLYRQKGGQCEQFNLSPLRLVEADLDLLEKHVKMEALPPTTGFFFGQSGPFDKAADLAFIKAARDVLKEGDIVVYDSWW